MLAATRKWRGGSNRRMTRTVAAAVAAARCRRRLLDRAQVLPFLEPELLRGPPGPGEVGPGDPLAGIGRAHRGQRVEETRPAGRPADQRDPVAELEARAPAPMPRRKLAVGHAGDERPAIGETTLDLPLATSFDCDGGLVANLHRPDHVAGSAAAAGVRIARGAGQGRHLRVRRRLLAEPTHICAVQERGERACPERRPVESLVDERRDERQAVPDLLVPACPSHGSPPAFRASSQPGADRDLGARPVCSASGTATETRAR